MQEFKIYKALGDPTRIEMIQRLSVNEPLAMGELTENLGLTRQGARKQLQVLVDSGVVSVKPVGRKSIVSLELKALRQARDFISKIEKQWDTRLLKLKSFVEND